MGISQLICYERFIQMSRVYIENPDKVTTVFFTNKFGGKWKLSLICILKEGPLTFGKMKVLIPSISSKVLTTNLYDLMGEGIIVKRTIKKESKTIYELSSKGESLYPLIRYIHQWTLLNYPSENFLDTMERNFLSA